MSKNNYKEDRINSFKEKQETSLSFSMEGFLNKQLKIEMDASQFYLSTASFIEGQGYEGVASFLYDHAQEEREHMLRILRYINERGGRAKIPSLNEPDISKYEALFYKLSSLDRLKKLFVLILESEQKVSHDIYTLVELSLKEKDYITFDFLQWYVKEQREEENLARRIIDKLNLIEEKESGLYWFDKEIKKMHEK